jgi:hypothetical protein
MTISKGKQRKEKQKPIKQYTVDKVINVIYTDDYYIFTGFLANKYI